MIRHATHATRMQAWQLGDGLIPLFICGHCRYDTDFGLKNQTFRMVNKVRGVLLMLLLAHPLYR